MKSDVVRQFVNIVAFVYTLVLNVLSQALPLNGQTPAEISNRLPILFVPANYVFSIWGVIYTLLIGFIVYQSLPSQRENPMPRKINYWFALSCLANGTWILFFHYNLFPLSMIAMVVLLLSLIMIYTRIGVGQVAVSGAMRWCLHIPFSVYMGWITVATVANAAYVLYDAGWDGLGISGEIWTMLLLLVATAITLRLIFTRRDVAYSAVLVWALIGIVVKQAAIPTVALTAGAMVVVIVVALVFTLLRGRDIPALRTPSTARV